MLSLFSPFSPSVLHSSPLSYVLHSSPLSFVDFLVVVGLTVGLGFGLGGFRFVRGFGFCSRRRSGLQFAVGGFAVLSLCRSGCGLISGFQRGDFARGGLRFLPRCRSGLISAWAWDCDPGMGLPCLGSPWVCCGYGLPWVLGEHNEENRNEEREKRNEEREKKLK